MKVRLVALEADKGLILLKQVVADRSVGIMADATVLQDGSMLENEGALLVVMAVVAEVIQAFGGLHVLNEGAVVLVAARTGHSGFAHGMM